MTSTDERLVPPITLSLEDEKCICLFCWGDGGEVISAAFESPEELLTLFLNGDAQKIVPAKLLLRQHVDDAAAFYDWLTDFDRENVMQIVEHIYFSDSADVDALPPSQRLRAYLAFYRDALSVDAGEQDYSCFMQVIREDEKAADQFERELRGTQEASYKAACKTVRDNDLHIPRGVMLRFDSPRELLLWLLRETVHEDRHIKRCAFCGRYFVPRRSTKQYCSEACAGKQRNADGFCGERDAAAAYKRIVSNLSVKAKKQKQLRRQYCLDDGAAVNPGAVLRGFYEENYPRQEAFRAAWEKLNRAEEKTASMQRDYERAKTGYLAWLDEVLTYAKRIHLDADSYWEE